MRVVAKIAACLLLVVACGQQPTVVPVRNLERPADMAFVCIRQDKDDAGSLRVSARPMSSCRRLAREKMGKGDTDFYYEEAPTPAGRSQRVAEVHPRRPRTRGTFGLVTNTARGEVAVVDLDLGRLVDLDVAQLGYNMLPVGRMPEVISVSTDGCQAVTVNRASCDFTVIDTTRLLTSRLEGAATPSTGPGPVVSTFVAASSPDQLLEVAPHEAAFVPGAVDEGPIEVPACDARGAVTPTGVGERLLVATFPSCDLVALLAVPLQPGEGGRPARARIVDSVRIRGEGVEHVGRSPSCPRECGGEATSGTPLAGRDAGAEAPGRLRVGPLAMEPAGRFVYVGALASPVLTVLQIEGARLVVPPAPQVTLAEGAGGVSRLRLAVDPFDSETIPGVGRVLGRFLGRGKFLYAFARDGSVRVLDVSPRMGTPPSAERECDVNVEPDSLSVDPKRPCFELGDKDRGLTWKRRPFAEGPGLRIPVSGAAVDFPPPLARDVSFLTLDDDALGYLLSSNGQVYILHLGPTPGQSAIGQDILTHTIRDASLRGVPLAERPDVTISRPVRDLGGASVPFPTSVAFGSGFAGPRIEREDSDPEDAEAPKAGALRYVVTSPRSSGTARTQNWSVTWEAPLTGADRVTGRVHEPMPGPGGPSFRVEDPGADLCRAGVEPGDAVALVGCLAEADCNPLRLPDGPVCHQLTPGVPGLCMTRARAKAEATERTCARHLGSRRRYQVLGRTATSLEIGLRIDELPRPAIAPCQSDAECRAGAPGAAASGWRCLAVTDGAQRRCVMPCEKAGEGDRRCRAGRVCEDVGSPAGPICVEAPAPDPACWPGLVRYRVQAGSAFVVSGSVTPRPTLYTAGARGECLAVPPRDPRVVERISLAAPACGGEQAGPEDGPWTYRVLQHGGARPSRGGQAAQADPPWKNPCLFSAVSRDTSDPEATGETRPRHVKAYFQNAELAFVLTNLEQPVGDGFEIRFQVAGGYLPDRVDASDSDAIVSLGTRILTSPTQPRLTDVTTVFFPHLLVIDQGRTTSAGSRGQILRIIPRTPNFPSGRFETKYTGSTFPIQ